MNLAAIKRALEDTQTEWGSSRWGTRSKCQRKHHLRYDVGLERLVEGPKEAYFEVGSFVHAILRYMQDGVVAGEAEPRRWLDVLEYASGQGVDPWPLDEAGRLMKHYWNRWGVANGGWGDPKDVRIVAVERALRWDDAALPHTGRADTILGIDGRVVVADTKTRSSKLPEDEEDRKAFVGALATNPQFLSLAAMVQKEMGLESPPDVLVNYIIKTKLPKFDRVIVNTPQRHVDIWAENHRYTTERMLAEQERGDDPYNGLMNLSECGGGFIGKPCYYIDYCFGSEAHRKASWKLNGN